MPLVLSLETLAAAYDYLRTTEPFSRWNLPDAEDIQFRVVRDRHLRGWYDLDGKRHRISISSSCVGRTDSLIETMAHEMVHLHQRHAGCDDHGEHGRAFRKLADQVCKIHGWDERLF